MNDNRITYSMLNANIHVLREASREVKVNVVKCETIEPFLFFKIALRLAFDPVE